MRKLKAKLLFVGKWLLDKNARLNDLNVRTKWSSLARLGNAPIVKASPIFPIIGYFLLTNESLGRFAQINDETGSEWIPRIEFLVFTLFGFGAALFMAAAPREIRRFPDIELFLKYVEEVNQPHHIERMKRTILGGYRRAFGVEHSGNMTANEVKAAASISCGISYTERVVEPIEGLLRRAFKESNLASADNIDHRENCLMMATWKGLGDEEAKGLEFWGPIYEDLDKQKQEIAYCYYYFRDYSRTFWRAVTALLFTIGLVFLAATPLYVLHYL